MTYTISIMIPANYDADSTLRPVIYAMDADQLFTSEASVLPTMGAPVSSAILVGISNLGSARRAIDFQMPGAAAYFQFLTLELIPYVDAHYRTDPKVRLLSGWSLSGLMSVYAMLLDDPAHRHFSAFMSADGSIWEQPAQVDTLAQQLRATDAELPVTLLLAAGENYKDNLALCFDLAALNYTGFGLRFGTYGQGHAGMVLPSFIDQLNYIFKLGPATGGSLGNCGA
ncbi:MAG: hypothetical protein JSR18_16775 [Proteobacteria bacterium]|nr:hypothetical protein [Pseudomonadota bacterium]